MSILLPVWAEVGGKTEGLWGSLWLWCWFLHSPSLRAECRSPGILGGGCFCSLRIVRETSPEGNEVWARLLPLLTVVSMCLPRFWLCYVWCFTLFVPFFICDQNGAADMLVLIGFFLLLYICLTNVFFIIIFSLYPLLSLLVASVPPLSK